MIFWIHFYFYGLAITTSVMGILAIMASNHGNGLEYDDLAPLLEFLALWFISVPFFFAYFLYRCWIARSERLTADRREFMRGFPDAKFDYRRRRFREDYHETLFHLGK